MDGRRGRGAEWGTMENELWGDCHVHSRWSDGLLPAGELTPFYEAFGYDFRIQSDHLVVAVPAGAPGGKWLHVTDWNAYADECAKASTGRHLCIPGAELGWETEDAGPGAEGWFDTKLYPAAGKPVPPESFFAGMTWAGALKALRAAGHRLIVAHADQGAPLDRLDGSEIDGIETRSDIEETRPLIGRKSLMHWDRMLSRGHRVSLSGGSDAHQPDEWAGSGLRTVVIGARREPGAILDAVAAGRAYLSSTWHPDCYAALGFPSHAGTVSSLPTRFLPWWDFPEPGRARELVDEGFRAALRSGRCCREDYPVLESFTVNGAGMGGETRAGPAEVAARWRMHLPVRVVRLVAGGRAVWEMPADHPDRGKAAGGLDVKADLAGARYVRVEIEAADPADGGKTECLLANSVYLSS